MKFGVSLYSYQVAYENGRMDLEACLKAMKELPGNVDGVEILADRKKYIPQSPYIGTLSEADQAKWKDLLAEYGMKATCYDSSLSAYALKPRKGPFKIERMTNPSKDEYDTQMEWFKSELDFCADFGFSTMRGPNLFGIYEEVIRDSLSYASDHGIKVCMEVHAPLKIKGDFVQSYAEMVDKACPGAGGFIPDFGIFYSHLPNPLIRKALSLGADPGMVKEIEAAYDAFEDIGALAEKIKAKTDNEGIAELLHTAGRSIRENPEDLKEIGKYIYHVHAKFYEVDENYIEHGIDFEGPLKALKDIGYSEYISSEYEGQRIAVPEGLEEVEQVRRQTVMTQNILEKL